MRFNRILKVGVELEGGWERHFHSMKHDGSVTTTHSTYSGEIASTPMSSARTVERWTRQHYPTEVNRTCGIHVHASFNELNYSRLIDPAFYALFLTRMNEFHATASQGLTGDELADFDRLRQRLDGHNQYCQATFIPDQQLDLSSRYGTPRYAHLNYCYGRHKTIECRVLPGFTNVEHALQGIFVYLQAAEDFLAPLRGPESAMTASVCESSFETVTI